MDKPDVIKHFGHLIAEERLIRISNFYVLADDVQNTRTNYIKVTMGSRIDHLITNDACAPQKLPKHCFDLVTISEVCHGLAKERGLIGKCMPSFLSQTDPHYAICMKVCSYCV